MGLSDSYFLRGSNHKLLWMKHLLRINSELIHLSPKLRTSRRPQTQRVRIYSGGIYYTEKKKHIPGTWYEYGFKVTPKPGVEGMDRIFRGLCKLLYSAWLKLLWLGGGLYPALS